MAAHTRVLSDAHGPRALERRLLRVQVKSGPDKGKSASFSEERIVIGSHARCDFQLTDPTASRQHCEVVLVPEGYLVRDLDSTNGTGYEGARLRELVITKSALLEIGDTRLALTPLDERVELPLPSGDAFGPLLGRSAAMRRVFDLLARFAASDITVLVLGESGTGKELAAQAIHEASPRARRPFVVVDCGSLPPTLIESELFGHVRGAFTGAEQNRVGAFESAHGGTIFLDEIGELPLELQSRLLGVLERRRVTPVGGSQSRALDVRVIAATNRDLRRAANRGTFREDLFFRLAVGLVEMPPLRERPEDIPLYVERFLDAAEALDDDALAALTRQAWPGNVRELRNALERVAALGPDHADLPRTNAAVATFLVEVDAAVPFKVAKALLVDRYTKPYLEALMKRHHGNVSQAARAADIDRIHLLRLLDRFDLRPSRT